MLNVFIYLMYFISIVGPKQPLIHISGPSFNDTLIFQSNGSQILHIHDTIHDDGIALEDVETYYIQFVSPNPDTSVNSYIRIGNDTMISIISDDSELNIGVKLLHMRILHYIFIILSFIAIVINLFCVYLFFSCYHEFWSEYIFL